MKQWTGAGFPLALLIALAALTTWLKHAVELPEARSGKDRHDPDSIIENARATRLDDSGRLRYTMQAERIVHYPDDDSTDVTRPTVHYLEGGRPALTLRAERAAISSDGDEIRLRDAVEVQRAAAGRHPALVARTTHLTVYPDDGRAVTNAPVQIMQGRSWLRGVGLELDHATRLFVLKSKVSGQFEPNRSKKSESP